MGRRLWWFGWAAVLWLALAGCASEADTWERVQRTGVLRVGVDPTFAPFAVANGQGAQGLDIDLAWALAGDLGLEPQFVYFGYDGLYDALLTEQVDVLISALVVQPERTRNFAYSDPYFDAGQVLVVPAFSDTPITTMPDLANRTLAVELGSQGHVVATEWQRRVAGLQVRPAGSAAEAVALAAAGEADAALVDHVGARLAMADHPGLQVVWPPVAPEPYAMVVRKEDERLLAALNESLARLKNAGILDDIINRWLDHPP